MPQAVDSELLLYADDTCLIFQHMNIKTIAEHLNRDFSTLVDWFVHNRLSVPFGEDKTKPILSPKHRSKPTGQIDISYKGVKIKQYSKVTYLGCVLDECLTGESMAIQVCTKVTFCVAHLFSHISTRRVQHGIQIQIRSIKTNCRFYKTNTCVSAYNWTTASTLQLNILTRLAGFQQTKDLSDVFLQAFLNSYLKYVLNI